MAQQISSKEQTLFRQLVKFYEAKQHKKALKTADQILKKNPDYADAIAMKVRFSGYHFRQICTY
jgi:peptide alpha-N-acetyltransferase